MTHRPAPVPAPVAPFHALMASLGLPDAAEVPEWVQLLPAGAGGVVTHDGRGPYRVEDAQAVIAASFADPRDATGLIVDENHAADLAAPIGLPSPAVGRIVEMQARPDGIWGRVEWNRQGRQLMEDRAYRGISPVIVHDAEGRVHAIKRASLTNYPNLRGLTSLNSETSMTFNSRLAERLGLPGDATEDAILAAIPAFADRTALQSSIERIGAALGVSLQSAEATVAAVALLRERAELATALQAEVTGLKTAARRAASEAYVDGQQAKGSSAVTPATRDHLIALHMENPDLAKKLIEAAPQLTPTHTSQTPPKTGADLVALNAEQAQVADLLGIPHDTFLAALNAEANKETA